MLNIIRKIYSQKDTDYKNIAFSIGTILACLLFVTVSDAIFYGITFKPAVYGLFTWGSIRIIGVFTKIGANFLTQAQAFSVAFFLYFIAIVLLGYENIALPLKEIAYISLSDFIIFSIFNVRNFLTKYLYLLLLGFIFALLLCAITTITGYQTPWFSYLSPAGIGYIDTFRDAAVIRGWSDYHSITHGTHGLLHTPYHSLFAPFHSAFLKFADNNAFTQLQYYGFIVAPALFMYGILKLIEIIAHDSVIKYKFWYAIIFALTSSALLYSFVQRSTMMATFLTIICIPLIFDVWKNRNASAVSLLILLISIPLMMYARAFHGLVLIIITAPLILDRRPIWKGIIPFLGCLAGLAVLILFYGEAQRNSYIYFSSVGILWAPQFYDPAFREFLFSTPLIMVTCLFIILWKKTEKSWLLRIESPYSRQISLGLLAIAAATVASLKAIGYSDTLYITILMSWILFFVLISSDVFPVVSSIILRKIRLCALYTQNFFGISVSIDGTKEILKKRQVNFIKYGILVLLILPVVSGIKEIQKAIRIIPKNEPYISLAKASDKTCPNTKYDPYCTARVKKAGIVDVHAFSETTLPAQIGEIAVSISKSLVGNTAIYLPPTHPYWNFFTQKEYSGLYFMAEYGIPLVYGLNNDSPGYGYPYVKYKGGMLKSLEEIGGVGILCKTVKNVHIDNVIIFSENLLDNKVISCQELAL